MTLHDKTASFETVMLRDALRKAAPHMAIGAGVGAAGGALMGGEGHRLEGALGGAALGAGAGGAVSHFGPAVRGWYEGLGRGASAAPAAATPAAIAQGSRRTVAGAAPATGIPEAWAPRLTQTPASVVSPQVSQTLDTMGRDARMAAGGGSARPRLKRGFDEGFLDALETFGLEKNAFFTAGLAAAGKALAPVAARAGAVAQRAAPVVSKGLQRAGNVLSHPLTDVGMSGAALWKNAAETSR